jgi:hypothetical protein
MIGAVIERGEAASARAAKEQSKAPAVLAALFYRCMHGHGEP